MADIKFQTPHMRVVANPDLGAEITHLGGGDGANLLYMGQWKTPLRASESYSYGSQLLDWLSEYRGGWQELFPNAGGAGDVLGVPIPFHGEVSRARWAWHWITPGTHAIMSCPARIPLVLEREMRLDPDRPVLSIEERVTSEVAFAVPYVWGHHPAWGPPLTAPGARIDLPAGRVVADAGMDGPAVDLAPLSEHAWPIATGRQGEAIDLSVIPAAPRQRLCFISELAAGWYAIRNPENGIGLAVAWDLDVMPCLWFWQEIGGGQGMPWYGRAEITALEPHVQWPSYGLTQAQQAGTARLLQPGLVDRFKLTVALFRASERPVVAVGIDGSIVFAD
jgi:hypothetical protein